MKKKNNDQLGWIAIAILVLLVINSGSFGRNKLVIIDTFQIEELTATLGEVPIKYYDEIKEDCGPASCNEARISVRCTVDSKTLDCGLYPIYNNQGHKQEIARVYLDQFQDINNTIDTHAQIITGNGYAGIKMDLVCKSNNGTATTTPIMVLRKTGETNRISWSGINIRLINTNNNLHVDNGGTNAVTVFNGQSITHFNITPESLDIPLTGCVASSSYVSYTIENYESKSYDIQQINSQVSFFNNQPQVCQRMGVYTSPGCETPTTTTASTTTITTSGSTTTTGPIGSSTTVTTTGSISSTTTTSTTTITGSTQTTSPTTTTTTLNGGTGLPNYGTELLIIGILVIILVVVISRKRT